MDESEIYYVKECWTDENKTLVQYIVYRFEDETDKKVARSMLNPKSTKMQNKWYLNKNMEIIPEN